MASLHHQSLSKGRWPRTHSARSWIARAVKVPLVLASLSLTLPIACVDEPMAPSLGTVKQQPARMMSYGAGEDAITLDPQQLTLIFSDGEARQYSQADFETIATVYQTWAEDMAGQMETMTYWATQLTCPPDCDEMRATAGESTASGASMRPVARSQLQAAADSRTKPAPVPPSKVRFRKKLVQPQHIRFGLVAPLAGDGRLGGLTWSDRRRDVLGTVTSAYESIDCKTTARAIWDEVQRYRQLHTVSESRYAQMNYYRLSAKEEYLLHGDSPLWRSLYTQQLNLEDQWKAAERDERESSDTLRHLADVYSSLGCWNLNSPNWPDAHPVGIAGTGFDYSCTPWSPWEISINGGPWITVQGRECSFVPSQA